MKIIDLATSLYKTELAEPSDISIPSLATYFRYNVGDLNNLLGTCFSLSPTSLEIIDEHGCEINKEAAMIYKYIYLLSYYARQIRANLGVGGVSQTLSIQSDGGIVRLVDKTQISKVFLQLREDTEKTLSKLTNKYKMHRQHASQVEGSDIYVSPQSYPPYNEGGILYEGDTI